MAQKARFLPALIALGAMDLAGAVAGAPSGARRRDRRGSAGAVAGRHARVVALDVARLRASPAAAKLAEKAAGPRPISARSRSSPAAPASTRAPELTSVTSHFPRRRAPTARWASSFVPTAGRDRLVAYVRDQLQKSGDDLVADAARTFHALVVEAQGPDAWSASSSTGALRAWRGGWGPRMADLAGGRAPSTAPPPTSIW